MTKERARTWNIEIHQNAKCFDDFDKTLLDIRGTWAYILHDKDVDDKTKEATPSHFHLVIDFENARTFDCVKRMFEGAHIERCIHFVASIQYLIHKNDKDKFQYDSNDVKTNMYELDDILESVDRVPFSIEDLKIRIESKEITSLLSACEVYSLKDINKYRCLIKDILDEYNVRSMANEELRNNYHRMVERFNEVIEERDGEIAVLRNELNERTNLFN